MRRRLLVLRKVGKGWLAHERLTRDFEMILFVNACIRGDQSRTLRLCREYLAGMKAQGAVVREVNLEQLHLVSLSAQKVAFRSQLQRRGVFEDDVFDLAHQFAEADDIVIGAPYWDLSFPAALKTYVEHVSVDNITFHYTEEGLYEGLCTAKRLTYITTSGCILKEEENLGYQYMCAIAKMFGIDEVRYVGAEGLDIEGANVEECLDAARAQIANLLEEERAQA